MSSKFRRDWLPNPLSYFDDAGLRLIGRGRWRTALCPFHDDRSPSLSVNVETGGFICHACGIKGGDIVSFHQQLHRLGFREAVQGLGAWA